MEGWVNVDIHTHAGVDIVWNVERPWPFPDHSVTCIYASHLLEHLVDFWTFFREAWRVLTPGGELGLRVPHGGSSGAWVDVTHVRAWYPGSFCFLQPGNATETRSLQHAAWDAPFLVQSVQVLLMPWIVKKLRRPWWRWALGAFVSHMHDVAGEMWVRLTPLSLAYAAQLTADSAWRGNRIFVEYGCWEHEWSAKASHLPHFVFHPIPGVLA